MQNDLLVVFSMEKTYCVANEALGNRILADWCQLRQGNNNNEKRGANLAPLFSSGFFPMVVGVSRLSDVIIILRTFLHAAIHFLTNHCSNLKTSRCLYSIAFKGNLCNNF